MGHEAVPGGVVLVAARGGADEAPRLGVREAEVRLGHQAPEGPLDRLSLEKRKFISRYHFPRQLLVLPVEKGKRLA